MNKIESMISIKDLNYFVPGKHILNNINVEIPKGKITTIIGPNGCGKSTLIKMISGVAKPHMGTIKVDGINRQDYKQKDFAKKVAFMMQFSSQTSGISVYDIVCYGREPFRKRFKSLTEKDYEIVDWAIKVTDIERFAERDINTLSGGEKQRVWMAMCLAQKPEVLVLDEPTNHLDIKYQYSLLTLIKDLNKKFGITIVLVLHDINQSLRFSDNIVVMKEGHVSVWGDPAHCITKDVIHDVYDVKANIEKDSKKGNHAFMRVL